ncbi:integrase core domain-containing protein [Streptomyces sp. NPDC002896]|uniref:integrase core domain-containing protein n=1 Tax=Streptomyces sp. NPDC002896 TaxID=3154438 RepID=UPI00331A1C54
MANRREEPVGAHEPTSHAPAVRAMLRGPDNIRDNQRRHLAPGRGDRLLHQGRARLAHRRGCPLAEALADPDTGEIRRIKLVTDNGAKFKGAAFARFIASRPELLHIRTRAKSPGQNGVRERAFGSLKYEHLYRLEIEDLPTLAREAEAYRHVFNHIRPHEALAGRRPIEVYNDPALHPQLSKQDH